VRVLNNHVGIVFDAPPGKSWLEEAALSIVILTIGRQQAISHQLAQIFNYFVRERACQLRKEEQFTKDESTSNLSIGEIARIFYQNIPHMLRAEQDDDWSFPNMKRCHATVFTLNVQ
jgi:hypothetical protein